MSKFLNLILLGLASTVANLACQSSGASSADPASNDGGSNDSSSNDSSSNDSSSNDGSSNDGSSNDSSSNDGSSDGGSNDGGSNEATPFDADSAADSQPDSTTGPCSCTEGCCLADGSCGYGDSDKECGNDGTWCQNCIAQGKDWVCRGKKIEASAPISWACLLPKMVGEACSDGDECNSGSCSPTGLCYYPCAPSLGICNTSTACCDPNETCSYSGIGSSGDCCVPVGGTTDDCVKCCQPSGVKITCEPVKTDAGTGKLKCTQI